MKRYILILVLLLIGGLPCGQVATAEAAPAGRRVFDAARLFTPEQNSALNGKTLELINKYQQDIVIVTTKNAQGKSAMAYADDYYDENGFGIGPDFDGLLLLIDMDNREIFITTTGKSIKIFSDARIERMLDHIFEPVSRNDYVGGANVFLKDTEYYLHKAEGVFFWSWELFGVGVFIVLVFMGAMVAHHKGGLLSAPSAQVYINNETCSETTGEDVFLHTSTRRYAINRDSSSSGGSGGSSTRTSSSGRTHGGGGRRF